MSLEDLGNIGELVAAIGVIISLIYLAVQIRQNTRATRASTLLGLTDAWQDYLQRATHPELSALHEVVFDDPENISRSDLLRFYSDVRVVFRRWECDFFQFRSGTFDVAAWEGYRNALVGDILVYPAFRAMWRLTKGVYAPEFIRFIDEEIERTVGLPGETRAAFESRWKSAVRDEVAAQQTSPRAASQATDE